MKQLLYSLSVFLLLGSFLSKVSPANADPSDAFVPEPLRPWVEWVKDKDPDRSCSLVRDARACAWPGKITLDLNDSGGTFHMSAVVERRGEFGLPGGGEVWPVSASAGSASIAMFDVDGRPVAFLDKGRYEITGRFSWDKLPQSLMLPEEAGMVDLKVDGKKITLPKLEDGNLWLEDEEEGSDEEEDTVQINVSRKLSDGVPFHVVTNLELRVSGKSRELSLGNVLPAGFAPVGVTSPLIYKLDQNWNLTLQVLPGVYNIRMDALVSAPPASLAAPPLKVNGWPREEAWVFEASPDFRVVELSGATPVDPERTRLPEDWKTLPAYQLASGEKIEFQEQRRGERDVAPNKLSLTRHAWLDLDGTGFTIQDQFSGQMNREWRLNAQPGLEITTVKVDGKEQVITQDTNTKQPGVELRSEVVNVESISRIGAARSFPAVGWDHDVDSLSFDLNVGPGWSLLNVTGVDNDTYTWFSSWTLWDIFFLCLMSIAVAKLLGLAWGLVTFAGLALCHGEIGAPVYIWLNILAGKALLMQMPENKAKGVVRIYYMVSFALLLSVLIPFAIDQIRLGLFPQLSPVFHPGELFGIILMPTIVIGCFAAFITAIVLLVRREYARAFQLILLSGALVIGSIIAFAVIGITSYQANRLTAFQGGYDQAAPVPQAYRVTDAPMQPKSKPMTRSDFGSIAGSVEQELAADSMEVQRQKLLQVDPKAIVQTGSALPTWHWGNRMFTWTGPVEKSRTISLYLLSPRMNCLLAFVRVALLTLLAYAFIGAVKMRSITSHSAAAIVLAGLLQGAIPQDANAQSFPGTDLLNELEQRIYRNECTENCVTVASLAILANGEELTVEADLSSDGPAGWPIPGPSDQFLPSLVTLDKTQVSEFRRTSDGLAWIRLTPGSHHVTVKGDLHGRSAVTLQFGIVPKHIEVKAPEWTVDGLSPTGSAQETIQLIRRAAAGAVKKTEENDVRLAEWYTVKREIGIGLPWTIENTAERLGDVDRAQILKLPLLRGESVTGGAVKVESGSAVLTFARNERRVQWSSTLKEEPVFDMKALSGVPVTESWVVRCSAIWRCSFEGIAPIATRDSGEYAGIWMPWPGESLKVSVSRPEGVAGQTATVDDATLTWRPGQGLLQGSVQFSLRTSQGGWRKIHLPEDAERESVSINGASQNLTIEKGEMMLPVSPGLQRFDIQWRQPWDLSFVSVMPKIDLGTNVGNINVVVNIPARRWILWTGGPRWGPAVQFWGALIVVALFAGLLGRLRVPPLHSWQWLLLGLGMATLHPAFILLPAAVCWLLDRRRLHPFEDRWKFNSFQILLGIMSVVTVVVLFLSIYHGLIVEPDMGISGNDSTNDQLRWFIDRSNGELPQPWVVTVPLWFWKVLMLAWSCWLVFSILKWPKWCWSCFSQGGVWRSKNEPGTVSAG